jgi:photosystem II stability/assembly factor-like uncharacterized protein
MNKPRFIAVMTASMLLVPMAFGQTAVEIGPAPSTGFGGTTGRLSAVIAHPTDPNLYYVGGADGGVWKTADAGVTWMPLTDQMPTTAIGALAFEPGNPSVIYAGTGEANFANHSRYGLGLMKSVDAGATWAMMATSTFAGRCFSKIVIASDQPQRLYAGITRAGGFPEMAAAKNHPQREGPEGIFVSPDGGVSWSHLTSGLPALSATDLAIHPSNSQIVYAGIGRIFGDPANGLYKTTSSGANWTKLTGGGFPAGPIGRVSLALAPSNPNRLYVVLVNPASSTGGGASTFTAVRSDDAGNTWTTISPGNFQASYGWYLSVIGVHPTNPDIAFFGGLSLNRTINAGGSYSNVTTPHVDYHAVAFDAAGRLLIGGDGGLHRSTAATPPQLGNSWQHLNNGLGTIQFYAGLSSHPTQAEKIFGGTQDNGSHRRDAAGKVWTHVTGGDGGWTQLNQQQPQFVYTESQGTGALNLSTNGGQSFNGAAAGLSGRNCFLPPYVIDETTPGRMLYATERLFESTDNGSTWSLLSADVTSGPPFAIRALALAPTSGQHVYVATNDFRVLSSVDGGKTFTLRLTDAIGWPRVTRELAVHPTIPTTVYLAGAAFGQAKVRRSFDAGASWQTLDGNLPDVPVNVIATDTRCAVPVLYAGTDAGVYRSADDGATWAKYGLGMPNACVIDLQMDMGRSRLLVGTQGRGAWFIPAAVSAPADCDGDGTLSINDFVCFQTLFVIGDPKADCDASGTLNIDDFVCFQTLFVLGC